MQSDVSIPMVIQIKKLRPDAVVPRYMTAGASGMDLSAALDAPVRIDGGRRLQVATGIAIKVPPGYEAQVRPRSGMAHAYGVTVLNTPGTLDSDYTGEIIVLLINHGGYAVRIDPGQRIAQLVIAPVIRAELVEVDELPTTTRGDGGFGSTGSAP